MADSIHPFLILGSGQLGLAVMDELAAQDKPVTLVNRSGKLSEALPGTANLIQADVSDPASVARIAQAAQVVFCCVQPPYNRWPELFPPLMRAVLEGMAQTQAKLVFGDNLYMYGPAGGQPIHEALPYAATGSKGRTRAAVAQMLLDAHQAGQVRVAIGRAADFYGPRVTGSALGETVFGAALAGKTMNLFGNIDLPHTYTFIRDFARGLVTLAEEDAADGRAWHVPSAPTLTTRQLTQLIAEQSGAPYKVRTAGRTLIALLGLFNPTLRELKELAYTFEEPYVVDHSRFAGAFGENVTPHPQAIAETLEWYRRYAAPA